MRYQIDLTVCTTNLFFFSLFICFRSNVDYLVDTHKKILAHLAPKWKKTRHIKQSNSLKKWDAFLTNWTKINMSIPIMIHLYPIIFWLLLLFRCNQPVSLSPTKNWMKKCVFLHLTIVSNVCYSNNEYVICFISHFFLRCRIDRVFDWRIARSFGFCFFAEFLRNIATKIPIYRATWLFCGCKKMAHFSAFNSCRM